MGGHLILIKIDTQQHHHSIRDSFKQFFIIIINSFFAGKEFNNRGFKDLNSLVFATQGDGFYYSIAFTFTLIKSS